MFYSQDRNQIRNLFRDAWAKHLQRQPMEPIEAIISDVVSIHPEYHNMLESKLDDLDKDYLAENGESNPFLHMGMHISLREQLNSDRPAGVSNLYKKILIKTSDQHETEHLMIECLAESLWQAQKTGQQPDEAAYLRCLTHLIQQF